MPFQNVPCVIGIPLVATFPFVVAQLIARVGPVRFNTTADVIRLNTDTRFPVGYGLKFVGLEGDIANEIQRLVDEKNREDGVEHQEAQ